MLSSNTITNVTASLIDFHRKVGTVKKDSVNPFHNSRYASLSNILTNVTPVLNDCGLSIVQMVGEDNSLTTLLVHESGEYIGDRMHLMPKQQDPQAQGSAITYARRYALGAILSLNIDEDDDGNLATDVANTRISYDSTDDGPKDWLNATNRDGTPSQIGQDVASMISLGSYTFDALYSDYKVSRKDRAMIERLVNEAKSNL